MNKVKLIIIKDDPYAAPVEIVQEVDFNAEQCADRLFEGEGIEGFRFGDAIVYTHGVQAFIFEDVKE